MALARTAARRRVPWPRALLALAAVTLCAGCGVSTRFARGAPLTIFQEQVHILADPTATLDTLRSLGVNEARITVRWNAFAPAPTATAPPAGFNGADPAAYPASAWAPYDAAVRAAAARGVGVYFLLTGPAPLWATTPAPPRTAPHNPAVYEPTATLFGAFVRAIGTRYDGHYTPSGARTPLPAVKFWGVWNEPNYGYDLAPQAIDGVEVSPFLYRHLLDAAWTALHATGHGGDTVLIGEIAPRGANIPGVANGMPPLRFLRALYCVGPTYQPLQGIAAVVRQCPQAPAIEAFRAAHPGLFDATGFAAHLYTEGEEASPELPSPPNEPDYAGLADLSRLERTLDLLQAAYGSHRRLPVYNTEFAFQTDPPPSSCACVSLPPAQAATYLNWSEYLEWSNPRVSADGQYLLYDAPGPPGQPEESTFSSGLLFVNGTPKVDYAAYRLPIYLPDPSEPPGRALPVWGEVRPADFAARDTGSVPPVEVQFQPAGHATWRTLAAITVTGSKPAFVVAVRFPRSGSVRLRWTYPRGFAYLPAGSPRTVTSRVASVTVAR